MRVNGNEASSLISLSQHHCCSCCVRCCGLYSPKSGHRTMCEKGSRSRDERKRENGSSTSFTSRSVLKWPSIVHCCMVTLLLVIFTLTASTTNYQIQCQEIELQHHSHHQQHYQQRQDVREEEKNQAEPWPLITEASSQDHNRKMEQLKEQETATNRRRTTSKSITSRFLLRRSPLLAPTMAFNEPRLSGSKSEPPSRPSVDWSKQRPYFGPDIVRNVSVELGKTAYLTCKVHELGDKTVSWLRPRENEILTVGKFKYIGDPRFASINENGSHDWVLEIKDVGLNDSTSYECQVSTDPKMSTIINLQVKESGKNGGPKDRVHHSGYNSAISREAQRNRQTYTSFDASNNGIGLEIMDKSGASRLSEPNHVWANILIATLLLTLSLFTPFVR